MRTTVADLDDHRVIDLLRHHVTTARAATAPGSGHALDMAELRSPNVTLWTIWDEDTLLAVGALKRLSAEHAEVKSMHTAHEARGRGIGSAMLHHIIAAARERGFTRLSLETGSWDYFRAARRLYARHGFEECAPFADYVPDPNSVFMSLDLRKS
jgi:putative acetyltransferase